MREILGIDFGTTNSVAAICRGGGPVPVLNEYGESVIPSAVYIDGEGNIYVGKPARNVSILHTDSTVLSVKRKIGTGHSFLINNSAYTPEKIVSFILLSMKAAAEKFLRHTVRETVITVPAHFDDRKRQAVKRASEQAGLEVVRLINEPTAAALAYGLQDCFDGTVAVYDLGGGTFDVSILRVAGGVFEVLATRGDSRLGGDDFDGKIVDFLVSGFREEHGIDLSKDGFAMQKIVEEAEKVKMALSSQRFVEVDIPFIAADDRGPLSLRASLSREDFEAMINGLLERTFRLTRGALRDAGLNPDDVDRLLLIGGSTRIPAIQSRMTGLFGRTPEKKVSPEEAVALGAAIQGGILSGGLQEVALVDVTPLGLGVEATGGKMVIMIPRNTVVPTRSRRTFTTVNDYQRAVVVNVLQGERVRADDNVSVSSFTLEGIRSAPRGEPLIDITFEIDVNGIVRVTAEDRDTGVRYGVTADAVDRDVDGEVSAVLAESRAVELEDILSSARGGES